MMTRIILSGYSGAMGKTLTLAASERDDVKIVGGVDKHDISVELRALSKKADVIVDFSHPSALSEVLDVAIDENLSVVLATTGYDEKDVAAIHEAAKKIPVFYSGNMSLGINLMQELCRIATRVLGGQANFDIEIIEKHHNKKIDAPSGTALMLANSISSALEETPVYEYNRQAKRERRGNNEIGIHAIRGGTIVGEHEVIFAGQDEILSISHSAASKSVFAAGALSAAIFIHGKPPGLYAMKDLIGQEG